MSKDMTAPNWARTRARIERNLEEARKYDVEYRLPDGWETPPPQRVAKDQVRKL